MKVDDIETKLDALIDMYKADRQPGAGTTTPSDDATAQLPTITSITSKLLHKQAADPAAGDLPRGRVNSQRCSRTSSSRPMLRNLSDLGPRVTPPSVSVMLSSPTVSLTSTSTAEASSAPIAGQYSPPTDTASTAPSRHPSTIHESIGETDLCQHFHDALDVDDSGADVTKQFPLPLADDRANHVALVDHVTASSSTIGRRTDSPPAEDSSQHTVIELTSLLKS